MRSAITRRSAVATLALTSLLGRSVRPVAAAAPPMPTTADLQKLLADENYAAAVAGATRWLAGSGPTAPAGADKAQVYAIKAQAHLHLQQFSPAADAFTRSAKAATDPVVAATGTAMALLIKRSHGGTYAPKQPGADGVKPSPVDIASTADHQVVLTDLFNDEFAADEPKLTAAKKATTVPQLQAAAELAALLRQVEVAATGADAKSEPEVTAIAAHAAEVLEAALPPMSQRVADIKAAADAPSPYGRRRQSMTTPGGTNGGTDAAATGEGSGPKKGLTAQDKSDLQSIIANAKRVAQASDTLARTTDEPKGMSSTTQPPASDGDAAPPPDGTAAPGAGGLAGVSTDAAKVASDANDVLTASYGRPGGR